jgi:predicted nucleic acid-binding protein
MPEHRRVVVANTKPIIALALIGQLGLLGQLYEEVLIPPAVEDEILRGGASGVGVTEFREAHFIRTRPLTDPSRADLLSDLDRGEAEVIGLSQEAKAGLVIIDERLARQHAKRLGLKLTGTLGVLLEAKRKGYVTALKPLIEQLVLRGIRLSDGIIAKVLRLAGESESPAL